MKRFLKVIDCTQQLQVIENVVGFEKALGAVKVIKDQIQYRYQSLLNLARDYFIADDFYSLSATTVFVRRNGKDAKNIKTAESLINYFHC